MGTVSAVFLILSLPIFVLGAMKIVYYPLALMFEARRQRPGVFDVSEPGISIIVPAYNEGRVISPCIDSLVAAEYRYKQIILVDDGSTDDTLAVMRSYETLDCVEVIGKANGGKASALNAGIAAATGEILFFVDADGLFGVDTIRLMIEGFDHRRVGAVCGNDQPVNLDRSLTRLQVLLTHVGTGFVRRALSAIRCMPVVSGNIGAFRHSVVEEIGGFREDLLGEDLELTWRVHRSGHRVVFRPRALVYAEVPSTIAGLWKQRVRWQRGLIQTVAIHRRMMFRRRYGPFGWYLPFNAVTMLVIPVLQFLTVCLLPVLALTDRFPVSLNLLAAVGWLGLVVALIATVFSVAMDRAWRDLRYLYLLPLWVPYSLLMSAVTIWALLLEATGSRRQWNKLDRTGVISRSAVAP